MTDLYMGAFPAVNFSALSAELMAALPGKLDGIKNNARNGDLWVIVSEGVDAESLRPDVAAVIAAHDPSVKTPAQQQTAARAAAAEAVKSADLAALAQSVATATTLEEVRPVLLHAMDLLGKLAVAQGAIPAAKVAAVDEVLAARPAPVEATGG